MPPVALAAVAGLLSALLYLPTLSYGWVWDDALLVAKHGAFPGGMLPFNDLLRFAEWHLGAGNPATFHGTNLLVHGIGTFLFCLLAIHVGAPAGVAFLASLLFGAHPTHVESVAFASGRDAMVASVLVLGAILAARTPLLCSREGCRSKTIYWAYLLEAAALRAHPIAFAFPFLVLAIDRWGPSPLPWNQRRVHYSGFFAIALVALLIELKYPITHPASLVERGLPQGHAFAAILFSIGQYLTMAAWAGPLNAIRSLSPETLAAGGGAWMLPAALAALIAALVWWRRHDSVARCGAVVLVLGLLPVLPYPWTSNPFAAERLSYLSSAGFVLLIASLLSFLPRVTGVARVAGVAAVVGLAGVAAYATAQRIPVWRDNIALLQASATASPHDPEVYVRIAEEYAAQGDAIAALSALDRAIARDSTRSEIYSRRALVLGSLQRWGDAELAARRAVALGPGSSEAWANLGDALAQQGKATEAVVASRKAVELDSTQAALWYNLGVSLAAMRDPAGAAHAYERALGIDSTDAGAWNNLGAIYGGEGRLEEARHAYSKAVELSPTAVQARMNLALAHLRLGDRDAAAAERTIIQRLDPAAARQLTALFGEAAPTPGAPAKGSGAATQPPRR